MSAKPCRLDRETFRPLTKHEIDHRIESLVAEVASGSERASNTNAFHPRWISAEELIRRMRPFVHHN